MRSQDIGRLQHRKDMTRRWGYDDTRWNATSLFTIILRAILSLTNYCSIVAGYWGARKQE